MIKLLEIEAFADADVPQNFYIVHRADGLVGSGTRNNPWDGSTAARVTTAFYAAMQTYETNPRSCVIHLGAGIFDLNDHHLPASKHIVIKGVSRDMTTLRRNATPPTPYGDSNYAVLFGISLDNNVISLHVSDLTIDANWNACVAHAPTMATRKVSSCCIATTANAARVSNVRFKGCGAGSHVDLVEVWGVGLFSGTEDYRETVVGDCIFEEPHTGKVNPIAIVSDPVWLGPNAEANGVIQNCVVYGGVTAFYAKMVFNCESRESQHGVFSDSHNALDGMVIANNRFIDCKGGGVILDTRSAAPDPIINGLIIANNFISCHTSATTFFGVHLLNTDAASPNHVTLTNSIVANNVVRGAAGANRYGLYASRAYGVTFSGNKVSRALVNVVTEGSNIISVDNTDEHSMPLIGFNGLSPRNEYAHARAAGSFSFNLAGGFEPVLTGSGFGNAPNAGGFRVTCAGPGTFFYQVNAGLRSLVKTTSKKGVEFSRPVVLAWFGQVDTRTQGRFRIQLGRDFNLTAINDLPTGASSHAMGFIIETGTVKIEAANSTTRAVSDSVATVLTTEPVSIGIVLRSDATGKIEVWVNGVYAGVASISGTPIGGPTLDTANTNTGVVLSVTSSGSTVLADFVQDGLTVTVE